MEMISCAELIAGRASAEQLKLKANDLYSKGNVEEAVQVYHDAVHLVDSLGSHPEDHLLLSTLHSNLSQAYFSMENYVSSVVHAESAVQLDTSSYKAQFRLVRARHSCGFSFDAFVSLHHKLLPTLRSVAAISDDERRKMVGPLRDSIERSLKLSDVSASLGVESCASGFSTVAIGHIPSQKVIFVEKRLHHPDLNADVRTEDPATTDVLVVDFAKQLVRVVEHETGKIIWSEIEMMMRGSWPRSLSDLPQTLLQHTKELLTRSLSSQQICTINKGVGFDPLMHLALVCRYNCFHAGFFRVCALANHSCNPTATMKYVHSRQEVALVSVKDIRVGMPITVKYLTDLEYLMGVGRRRQSLYRSWLFWCFCERCQKELHPSATEEQLRCSACTRGYVHLPLSCTTQFAKGSLVTDNEAQDPMITDEGTCDVCGVVRRLLPEESAVIDSVRDSSISCVSLQWPLAESRRHVAECYIKLRELVHRDHWIYRIVLYCFALAVQQGIGVAFESIANRSISVVDAASGFLRCTDEGQAPPNGGDTLQRLLELYHRIERFYPPSQGWAMHMMICRLLMFSLFLVGEDSNALGVDEVLRLLDMHTPFCGAAERASMHRTFCELGRNVKLSAKQSKQLKGIFTAKDEV